MRFGINKKRLLALGLAAALLWSDTSMVSLAQTQGEENGSELQEQYQTEALTEPTVTPEGASKEPAVTPEGAATTEPTAIPEGTASAEPAVTPEGVASAEPTATPEGTATPEATASTEPSISPEPSASPEELKSGVLELRDVYQEGSFSVSGGISDGAEFADLDTGDNRKKAEEYIYQQALAKSTSIDVSSYQIPVDELNNFFSGIINEHPELYDIGTSVRYSYTSSGYVAAIKLQYIDGYDDAAFQAGVSAAMSVIQTGMTDLEKAIALHDYLVLFNAYDYDNLQAKTESPSVYRAYGALVNGSAVCQGYALAYKYLCEKAGIPCYMVTSDTMNHAWNLIQLDEEFYQVDVTWDDPVYDRLGLVGHNYMFVSDSAFENRKHSDWQVTKGSSVVNLTAEDDSYDDAYWTDVTSPMIWKDDIYYYITDSTLQKRDTATDTESVLYNSFGRWYVPGNASASYSGTYSGLFCLGDRLYFNNADQIFSIPLSGGTTRAETEILSTSTGIVYGCTYMNGKVTYVLSASPNMTGKETVYDAELAGGIPVVRQLDKPVFSPASESSNVTEFYKKGEVTLSAEEGAAIYYTTDGTTPEADGATTKVYTAPIEVTTDITINAIAVKTGLRTSEVATAQYRVCDKVAVSSYAELKQKFPVSEESGVKVITLDKDIRITDEIVIDETVQLVAETGKEISITSGALLKVKSGGTLTLGKRTGAGSITLKPENTASYLIENQSGGSLEIGDGVSLVNGGVLNDGSMKLTGGIISGSGYGICHRGSELEISGGTIEKSTMYGVYLDAQSGSACAFRMKGGSIQYGGDAGVYLSGTNYTFDLEDGFIISNKNRGILNDGSGIVTISGGKVRGNIVKNKTDDEDQSGIGDDGIWARYAETVVLSDPVKVSDVFGNNGGSSITASKLESMLMTMTLQKGAQDSLQAVFSGEEYPVYTVEDESILTVDREGNVTAKELGTTSVKAVLGETSKTCTVTVRELFWDKESIVLEKGYSQELTLKERRRITAGEGSGTTEETVSEAITWKMTDEDVASVTKKQGENGVVVITGVNGGHTTLTACIGKNTGTDKNQLSATIDIEVIRSLTGVSLSENELTLTKGETVTIKAYAIPLDATEEGSISISTEASCLKVTDSGTGEASIEAVSAGTGTVVAQLTVGGAVRATTSAQVTVYEKAVPEVETLYVLTNNTVNLKDVKLPDNFKWKENAKLTASTEKQQYIAVYTYPELDVTEEVPVDVYVGTITGITVEGCSLVESGGTGELTVKPVYRGAINENESFDYEVICPELLTASTDEAPSEDNSKSYTIQPKIGSAGKKLTLTFKGGLSGTDFSNNKEKNKKWFEKKFTVSVGKEGTPLVKKLAVDTDSLIEEGKTVLKEADGRSVIVVDASCLKTSSAKFSLKVLATGGSGLDITKQAAFSYKIDRTGVASIDQKGQITCKSVGTALITVTAKDGTGVKTQIGLEVRDYHPKMSQTALTMNLACREEVTCILKPAQDSRFTEESFTLMMYDSKRKTYVDATGYFTWDCHGNVLTIAPGESLPVKAGKKVTYQLSVGSKVLAGTETKSFEGSNGNIIKVTVSNTVPKVSVKQSGKLNLFYKDATAQAVLTVSGAEIESVTWKDETKTDFTVELEERTAGRAVIRVGQKEGLSNRKKPDNQGVLQIRLKDYGETPVEVSYKVTTEYRKPTFAWKDNSLKWMPGWSITSAETVLLDKTSKTAVDLEGMALSIDKGYKITQQESVPGGVCIETVGTLGRKATVEVNNDNYAEAVTVPVSFSETKPVAVLSTKSITLSTQYTVERYEPYAVTVSASEKVKDIRILSVQGTDQKTKQASSKGLISVQTSGNQVLFGLQTVIQDGKDQTASKGTYTFQITPQAGVETNGGIVYRDMTPVKVTVKVVDKPAAVTLSGNSKLNLLDRSGAGVLVFTPKLANTSATIRDVKLQGAYADRFTCALEANGKLTLQAKEEAELDVKKTYPVTPVYTLSDGSVVKGSAIKIQTVYPTVKFTVAEKNITLFRSARGKQNGEKVTLAATLKGSAFTGTERITSVTSMTQGFVYDYEDGVLYIDDAYKLPTGGSTNVMLRVTFKGQASQGTTFDYKVKVSLKE